MGDSMGQRSDITITADGQEMTIPIGEWTAFLETLEQDHVQGTFERGGPEAKTAYRKLVSLSPTTAA